LAGQVIKRTLIVMSYISKKLINAVTNHEGIRLFPYFCTAGALTIGVGRNLDSIGITDEEARFLLNNDLCRCEKELSKYDWFNSLSEVRREVLIELNFNIGLTSLLKFKKMIKFLTIGSYRKAADEMLDSRWYTMVSKSRSSNMAYRLENGKY